jgi:hypothetical protein
MFSVLVAVKDKQVEEEEFPVSTLIITTCIIGGAVIVIVAAIMCGIIHMKKYKYYMFLNLIQKLLIMNHV